MREEFYEIYNELITNSLGVGDRTHLENVKSPQLKTIIGPEFIKKTIESVEKMSKGEIRLRPDAKYFLIVNFHQMIIIPVVLANPQNFREQEMILEAVGLDVSRIVNDAGKSKKVKGEITGGDILSAVRNSWDTLQVNGLRFWGPNEQERQQER